MSSNHAISAEILLEGQKAILALVAKNAPLRETLRAIAKFAEASVPGLKASILYYDVQTNSLRSGGYAHLPDSFAAIVDGLVPGPNMGSCGTCAHTGERIISVDVREDPLWTNFLGVCDQFEIRAAWSTPLLHSRDSRVLGVFGMYFSEPRAPSVEELRFVDHFISLAAIAAERRYDAENQRRVATSDALTGLCNRDLLAERGPDLLSRARRARAPLTVAYIDVDRFKSFNDLLGHSNGDRLLRRLAEVMAETLAPHELLARFGGDEFIALFPLSIEDALERLDALKIRLSRGLQVDGAKAAITFSAGLASNDDEDADFDTLIFRADEASRAAKTLGGDQSFISDTNRSERSLTRLRIARGLAAALDTRRLDPHLQPIVNIKTGRASGFELLFRVNDPFLRATSIVDLIGIAEETGQIHRIGGEMIRAACELIADPRQSFADLTLNVNVSVLQLMRGQFVDETRRLVEASGIDPRRISLELTESHWLDAEGQARSALGALREMGFQLALDDFGTGYASLTNLQTLPFDTVKIDRSFIERLGQDAKAGALCGALLAMGKACGMSVVAEGVETEAQARALVELGYETGQGYLWAKPMSRDAAIRWLLETRAAA